MKNGGNEVSDESKLNDTLRLAIREEVERRFEHPPDAFGKRIDNAAENSVETRVKHYKAIAIIAAMLLTGFLGVFWNRGMHAARQEVAKQLATEEIVKAKDRIAKMELEIAEKNQRIMTVSQQVEAQAKDFMARLEQIKQKDNVVLLEKDGSLHLRSNLFLENPTGASIIFTGSFGRLVHLTATPTEIWLTPEKGVLCIQGSNSIEVIEGILISP